ncbi:acetyl-CoA carboxylase biotin carboxyl carrier protein [Mediterraneibacter sp. ICN-202921]|uniref:acetyl-CoA carboxylase biotin carboxyl carrier protein n=1 Tax=Mediterraneibacter sp. ICN-202921 TaxID=3134657 RepID=UPI0030BD8662
MKFEELLQLVEAVSRSELTELKYEKDDEKVCLRKREKEVKTRKGCSVLSSAADISAQDNMSDSDTAGAVWDSRESGAGTKEEGSVVKSPLVGTFYAAPAEDASPYVKVGDTVKEGQVLAIVEAMKLMNEIESEFSGEIVQILVSNGEAVEYGQPLFVIR